MKDRQLILKSPEGQFVEFKQSINSTLAREIVGFANTGGGTIVIGVDDNGIIKGMRNINKDVSKIESIARNCDPPISILINLEQKMGKDLLFIDIPDSPEKPHSCSDGFFLRSGATTQKMTRNEIIHFLHSTNQILWDKKKCFSFKYPE
ncbi:MAG TPA: ATP-binding protein, partial [Euryarchaeota archaeon]|nr:ATP-binding protein [Euryarchaeota archaeon]